jgi:hypothetical protein
VGDGVGEGDGEGEGVGEGFWPDELVVGAVVVPLWLAALFELLPPPLHPNAKDASAAVPKTRHLGVRVKLGISPPSGLSGRNDGASV